jgi:hypothetical protein
VFDQDIAVMEGQQRINSMMPNAPTVEIRCDVPVVAMHRLVMQAAAREHGEPITATRVQPGAPRPPLPVPAPAGQPIEIGPVSR